MRVAAVFRGIHYLEKSDFHVYYRDNWKNMETHILEPLRKDNQVDIFCLTYVSPKMDELVQDLKPVDCIFLTEEERDFGGGTWNRQRIFHGTAIQRIREYENEHKFQYDLIMITRFDNLWNVSLSEQNINYTKFNIMFKHLSGNCDDNYWIFPRKYLDHFEKAILSLIARSAITHELCHYLPDDIIHYMLTFTAENPSNEQNIYCYPSRRRF